MPQGILNGINSIYFSIKLPQQSSMHDD